MVLLAFILCGLAAGLARGGSLRAMAQHDIALLWLPVAAYLCKAAGPYAARLFPAFASYAPLAVCLLHYGLLFIFVAANLRRGCCFSKRMRNFFRKNEKSVLQFCNKKPKRKGRLQRVEKSL